MRKLPLHIESDVTMTSPIQPRRSAYLTYKYVTRKKYYCVTWPEIATISRPLIVGESRRGLESRPDADARGTRTDPGVAATDAPSTRDLPSLPPAGIAIGVHSESQHRAQSALQSASFSTDGHQSRLRVNKINTIMIAIRFSLFLLH